MVIVSAMGPPAPSVSAHTLTARSVGPDYNNNNTHLIFVPTSRLPSGHSLCVCVCVFGDERGYVLYPQIGDRLDLVCPASAPAGPRSTTEYEYYKLYLVSTREQADRCEVMGAPNLLLTCDRPNADMRFTIKFQEFSPNLWGHEFKNLQDYYIIELHDTHSLCVCVVTLLYIPFFSWDCNAGLDTVG
ncbi:hypothetical protein NFI96_004588 [Prochilodus magdalenae]|nr:hypothetical protein NFI96_004588 [Prochilodus magdalenae]